MNQIAHSPTQRKVPRLSLETFHSAATRQTFIDDLYSALNEFGFVVIADHGISSADIGRAYHLCEQLFNLPFEIKNQYGDGSGQRGYTPFGREHAAGNPHPDLKEYWHIGPEVPLHSPYHSVYPSNYWPSEIPAFKPFFRDLYLQLLAVASQLLGAIGDALTLPQGFMQKLISNGNSVHRLLHYPATEHLATENSLRAAPHADINLMTLLVGATDSGLELKDRDGSWLAIDGEPDDIIVDTGDMMALITNNHLPATLHRVINPVDTRRPRYSMPFFVHPHNDALLECLPPFVAEQGAQFSPITAGDFLQQRLRENGF